MAKRKPLESQVQTEICQFLTTYKVYFWRNNNTPIYDIKRRVHRAMPKYTPKGLPDIIVIRPGGKIHGLEVKRPGSSRLSEHQSKIKAEWEALGARYDVVRSIDDVKKVLDIS